MNNEQLAMNNKQLGPDTWPAPNFLQAIELVTAANEVGKALGWRRPTAEESELMNAVLDTWHSELSDTPSIPGML